MTPKGLGAVRFQKVDLLTSLRITQTGESVNTERRMASRGPKDGSTSPSAIPFWKVPGTEEDPETTAPEGSDGGSPEFNGT